MKALGKAVFIERPIIEENKSGIELLPEAEKAREEELVKKFTRLKVFAVGDEVTKVKTGDEILVTPKVLSYMDQIELDGKFYFLGAEHQVAAIF